MDIFSLQLPSEEGRVEGAVGPAPGCPLWKGTGTARGAKCSPGVQGRARAQPCAAGGDVTAPGLVLEMLLEVCSPV